MLTLTKFPNKYLLDKDGKRIKTYVYYDSNDGNADFFYEENPHYPCEPARRWMRAQVKKGLTPKQIWEKCERRDWIYWILCKVDSSFEDTWPISDCNELRALVKWKDVRNALIKHGWR